MSDDGHDYNYAGFPLDMDMADFDAFPTVLRAGHQAPGGELVDAASGETVALSGLWRSGPLMIEFGSIT